MRAKSKSLGVVFVGVAAIAAACYGLACSGSALQTAPSPDAASTGGTARNTATQAGGDGGASSGVGGTTATANAGLGGSGGSTSIASTGRTGGIGPSSGSQDAAGESSSDLLVPTPVICSSLGLGTPINDAGTGACPCAVFVNPLTQIGTFQDPSGTTCNQVGLDCSYGVECGLYCSCGSVKEGADPVWLCAPGLCY